MANLTKKRDVGRQTTLVALVQISFADFLSGGPLEGGVAADTVELAGIPKDAFVTAVAVDVTEAFVGATSPTLAVDDADLGTNYVAAVDLTALATTDSTAIPVNYTAPDVLIGTLGGTGFDSVTAGAVQVRMEYVQKGRSNEVHE